MFERPLVNYVLFLIIGCIFALMILDKNLFGITLVMVIIILIYYSVNSKSYFFIMISFFIIGTMSFYLFFRISMGSLERVRVIEKNYYGITAEFKNRKVYLNGNINNLKEGMLIKIEGNFNKKSDYSKGIIGTYNVKNYFVYNNDLIYKLYKIKEKIYEKYFSVLGENASLIMALCCGDANYISYENKNDFIKLGIIHLLCISGFHISIVYKFLEKIFRTKLSLPICFIYVIFTGSKAPVLRAYIMILIYKASKLFYKKYDPISSVSLAALILLLIKPYYIIDIGFGLSFLAVLGIVIYNRKYNNLFYKLPNYLNISLSCALSAQIFTLPYIAFTIQNLSLFSIIGNIALVPIYSFIIILGNISLLIMPFKSLFKFVCYILESALYMANGANYLFLKICPDFIKINTLLGMVVLTLYMYYFIQKYYNNET